MKKIYLILCFFFLAGCATEANFRAAMNQSLGISERELINRLGVPHKTYQLEQTKYLTYSYSASYYVPQNYQTNVYGYGNYATAYTNSYGGYSINRTCSVTFTIERGIVVNWRSEGNDCRA